MELAAAHWSIVPTPSLSTSSVPPSVLSRAGHSAVVQDNFIFVYSGYRFSADAYSYIDSTTSREDIQEDSIGEGEVLRYDLTSGVWEALNTSSVLVDVEVTTELDSDMGNGGGGATMNNNTETPPLLFPQPRYGHTAVIHNVSYWLIYGRICGGNVM